MIQKVNPIKIFLLCPIPEEQKPISEYINLKKYFSKKINSQFKQNSEHVFLFFSRFFLILRWKDIEKRFNQSSLVYEEGSWYDGQIWEKSFSMIKNDRLLSSQIIQESVPKFKKILLYCFVFFVYFFLFVFLNWFFHFKT